jgi:phosphoribosylformylglycinamidine synthase subunit PurL
MTTSQVMPRAGDPEITPALIKEHGITPDEYERGGGHARTHADVHRDRHRQRAVERALLVQALAPVLRTLPTEAPWVLQGPGENAGVIAVGRDRRRLQDRVAQSPQRGRTVSGRGHGRRRHPARRLHHGRAPDRPAQLAALRSARRPARALPVRGRREGHRRLRQLRRRPDRGRRGRVRPGVRGQPAGQRDVRRACCARTSSFVPLPRASATRSLRSARARDATAFTARRSPARTSARASEAKRPRVQVGDPFTEKLLLEASSSSSQRTHRRHSGHGRRRPHVERRPRWRRAATWASRSTPRGAGARGGHDAVRDPAQRVAGAHARRRAQGARGAGARDPRAVGPRSGGHRRSHRRAGVSRDGRRHGRGRVPGHALVTDCPVYTIPRRARIPVLAALRARDAHDVAATRPRGGRSDLDAGASALVAHDREQGVGVAPVRFDGPHEHHRGPGPRDAAVVRLRGTDAGVALKIDCNGRYVALDPRVGGRIAVCEAARNVACSGARPRAITNNLNFGNPDAAGSLFQFRERGGRHGRGVPRARDAGHRRQRLAVQRESQGAIHPTPTVGMVGVLETLDHVTPSRSASGRHDRAARREHRRTGRERVSASHSRVTWRSVRRRRVTRPRARLIDALLEAIAPVTCARAHDCSDGGLAVALAECAMMRRDEPLGFQVDLTDWADLPLRALLFGEAQGRIVTSTPTPDACSPWLHRHGVPARDRHVWSVPRTGSSSSLARCRPFGHRLRLPRAFHDTIPGIMDGGTPAEAAGAEHARTLRLTERLPMCGIFGVYGHPTRRRSRSSDCTPCSIAARSRPASSRSTTRASRAAAHHGSRVSKGFAG